MEKNNLINFENEVIKEYEKGLTYGPIHLSGGNEIPLLEVFKQINKDDWVFSNHRSHYHAYLKMGKEIPFKQIIEGNSSHINFKEHKFFTSSIVGGCIPIALGTALAIKRKGENNKVWCFIGDHASEMGNFWEAVKYAENFDLPITYIVEDNQIGSNIKLLDVWNKRTKLNSSKVIYYDYIFTRNHYGIGRFIHFKRNKRGFKSQGGMYP